MSCESCGAIKQILPNSVEETDVFGPKCFKCLIAPKESLLYQKGRELLSKRGYSFIEFHEALKGGYKDTLECWQWLLANNEHFKRGTSTFLGVNKLSIGDKVWRPLNSTMPVFKKGKDFQVFAKQVGSMNIAMPHGPGMVLFVNVIPKAWTAFTVTGFASNGRSGTAVAHTGSNVELINAHKIRCPKCNTLKAPAVVCKVCTKPKRFVCRACSEEAAIGKGRCAICQKEYV